MVMWKMVLLFSCLVVCTNLLQYCQTTRQQNNKTTKQQNNKTTKQQICIEDSTFQHSEKEATDKNKAQKVMLCKSIAFTLQ